MAIGFPPLPVYPNGIDSDTTLYLVFNTAEALLARDNEPFTEEIEIVPVFPGENDVWPNNGFATISGELFYFDAVEKNEFGKVNKLKRIARNLGGSQTQFNKADSCNKVRGFVVAEHHNQLVDTICKIEKFVGTNFTEDCATLDKRIRSLQELGIIFDDFSCPDVSFTFITVDNDPTTGVLINYFIDIQGIFTSFRLDFGDGDFTTSIASGTKRYAPNSTIDPVITISNDRCEITQTNIARLESTEPRAQVEEDDFEIPIPEIPEIPEFECPDFDIGAVGVNLPPIIFPCLTLESPDGSGTIISAIIGEGGIPSNIELIGINIPSIIEVIGGSIPSFIDTSIPSRIFVDPVIPPVISIDPPIPPVISVDIDLAAFDNLLLPMLGIEWGNVPQLDLNLNLASPFTNKTVRLNEPRTKPRTKPINTAYDKLRKELGEEFEDFFGDNVPEPEEELEIVTLEAADFGFPSEIRIIPPDIPDVRLVHEIPTKIDVEFPEIPDIKIHGPDTPLPKQIEIVNKGLIPTTIAIDATNIPNKITLDSNIPSKIMVEMVKPIPTTIMIDGSSIPDKIQVVGFPESIELKAPSAIPLTLPEDIEVPLVFKGDPIQVAPIDVKIEMDIGKLIGENEEGNNCVMITPCPAR